MYPEAYERIADLSELRQDVGEMKSIKHFNFELGDLLSKPNHNKLDSLYQQQELKEKILPLSTNSSSKGKYHQNSLQYILQQKAKQIVTPSNNEKITLKAHPASTIHRIEANLKIEENKFVQEKKTIERKNANEIKKQNNSPLQMLEETSHSQNLKQLPELKKLSYQKDISIDTGLEPMDTNINSNMAAGELQAGNENSKLPGHKQTEKGPYSSKSTQKNFMFSDQIFNPLSPASPHRSLLFGHFIKERIGEERFEKLKILVTSSSNPNQLLEEQNKAVLEIIGEEHKECLIFLRFMINSANNPKVNNESKFNIFDKVKSTTPIHCDGVASNIKGSEKNSSRAFFVASGSKGTAQEGTKLAQ